MSEFTNLSDFIDKNWIQVVFIVNALIGGLMHYLKKFLKGETDKKVHQWFGSANIAATMYTVIVFFFAIIGAIAADVVNSETGFWAAMYSGFVTGFAIDAGFNSDDKSITSTLIETRSETQELLNQNSSLGKYSAYITGSEAVAEADSDEYEMRAEDKFASIDDTTRGVG